MRCNVGSIVRGAVSSALLSFCLMLAGCGGDDDLVQPPGKEGGWTDLGLSVPLGFYAERFSELRVHDGDLFLVARVAGVFVQRPAGFGEWDFLGLDGANPDDYHAPNGIAFHGQDLIVSQDLNARPNLFRRVNREGTSWEVLDAIASTGITDIKEYGEHLLIAPSERRGVFVSEDGGDTWERVLGEDGLLMGLVEVYSGSGLAFLAGFGLLQSHYLLSSRDGRTWSQRSTRGLAGAVSITSVDSWISEADTLIVLSQLDGVYVGDGSETYRAVLSLPGGGVIHRATALVSPEEPDLLWVAADSLYHSEDRGETWRSWAAPDPGGRFATITIDWTRRRLFALVLQPETEVGSVYCVDLGGLDSP